MNNQLELLEDEPLANESLIDKGQPAGSGPRSVRPRGGQWPLDDHTREVGRRGLASARQALRQAAPPVAA